MVKIFRRAFIIPASLAACLLGLTACGDTAGTGDDQVEPAITDSSDIASDGTTDGSPSVSTTGDSVDEATSDSPVDTGTSLDTGISDTGVNPTETGDEADTTGTDTAEAPIAICPADGTQTRVPVLRGCTAEAVEPGCLFDVPLMLAAGDDREILVLGAYAGIRPLEVVSSDQERVTIRVLSGYTTDRVDVWGLSGTDRWRFSFQMKLPSARCLAVPVQLFETDGAASVEWLPNGAQMTDAVIRTSADEFPLNQRDGVVWTSEGRAPPLNSPFRLVWREAGVGECQYGSALDGSAALRWNPVVSDPFAGLESVETAAPSCDPSAGASSIQPCNGRLWLTSGGRLLTRPMSGGAAVWRAVPIRLPTKGADSTVFGVACLAGQDALALMTSEGVVVWSVAGGTVLVEGAGGAWDLPRVPAGPLVPIGRLEAWSADSEPLRFLRIDSPQGMPGAALVVSQRDSFDVGSTQHSRLIGRLGETLADMAISASFVWAHWQIPQNRLVILGGLGFESLVDLRAPTAPNERWTRCTVEPAIPVTGLGLSRSGDWGYLAPPLEWTRASETQPLPVWIVAGAGPITEASVTGAFSRYTLDSPDDAIWFSGPSGIVSVDGFGTTTQRADFPVLDVAFDGRRAFALLPGCEVVETNLAVANGTWAPR